MAGEILAGFVHPGPDIRAMRLRLGWSQPEAAKRFGVNVRTLSRWENMRARPSNLALQKVSETIKASLRQQMYKNRTSLLPTPR